MSHRNLRFCYFSAALALLASTSSVWARVETHSINNPLVLPSVEEIEKFAGPYSEARRAVQSFLERRPKALEMVTDRLVGEYFEKEMLEATKQLASTKGTEKVLNGQVEVEVPECGDERRAKIEAFRQRVLAEQGKKTADDFDKFRNFLLDKMPEVMGEQSKRVQKVALHLSAVEAEARKDDREWAKKQGREKLVKSLEKLWGKTLGEVVKLAGPSGEQAIENLSEDGLKKLNEIYSELDTIVTVKPPSIRIPTSGTIEAKRAFETVMSSFAKPTYWDGEYGYHHNHPNPPYELANSPYSAPLDKSYQWGVKVAHLIDIPRSVSPVKFRMDGVEAKKLEMSIDPEKFQKSRTAAMEDVYENARNDFQTDCVIQYEQGVPKLGIPPGLPRGEDSQNLPHLEKWTH